MYRAYLEQVQNNMKNVLIVFAHQHPKSFNGAMLDEAVQSLKAQGHNVTVSNLYAQHFEPRATRSDIIGAVGDDNKLDYPGEASKAYKEDRLAWDSSAEIEKLKKADLVIFQFPMYWLSVPAILKGWFDRVLISGVAFDFASGSLLDNGLMKGKRAVLSFTTGGPETLYTPMGMNGDINVILWPIQYGALRFCGFDVLAPEINFGVGFTPEDVRKDRVKQWGKRLQGIFDEKPLSFVSLSNYDTKKGFQLSDEFLKSAESKSEGPSVGQNLGKALPKNSMTQSS